MGDRPATRKHERPLGWDALPFATAPLVTSEDAAAQTARVSWHAAFLRACLLTRTLPQFLEIWSEDGVAAEPEDDMMMM